MDGNINFYSVSADGRVVTWKLVKNELQFQDALTLKNTKTNEQRDFTLSEHLSVLCRNTSTTVHVCVCVEVFT